MSKILGIVGSPRINGNTHILVSRVLEGARDRGAATELLLLSHLRIEECIGCLACWKGKRCSRRDDMNGLYEKIIESDGYVFGTPVYWYGPTALLKAFIDRFVYFNCPANRAKIRGNPCAIAIPFEEDDPEAARLTVAFFKKTFQYLELKLIGRVLAPGVGRKGEIARKEAILEKGYALGRKLAASTGRPGTL